ncbi:beta-ketoacyl synthase N-terminal-like domain-containing protein [Streptomyces sp. NPDC090131]|uniref:beta-ketoacyl synthase N-terminal-like domain-containing protein n=1 Tax=Streptomyces sp. NPDC090131 TaxID=3365954 RepID=UPI0038211EBA
MSIVDDHQRRPALPSRTVVPLALDTAGVVSAAGVGLQPLADALRAGAVAGGAPPAAHEAEDYPPLPLRPADIVAADLLGPKGLNRLTRAEQLGMAACTLALGPVADRSATGVVLGSAVGSSGGVGRFTRDTFVQERPYMVNPSAFPGTLMNAAAGRTAIRHGLTDANATVSGGPLASLHALRFARNALVAGHARRLLTGGVEELSPQSAWAWQRAGSLAPGTALGEGAAVFALRTLQGSGDGESPLALVMAVRTGFAAGGPLAVARRLSTCVRDALARSGVGAQDIAVVAPGAAGRRGWAAVEERALRTALDGSDGSDGSQCSDGSDGSGAPRGSRGRDGRYVLRVQEVLGETHGASAALQVAGVVARWHDPHLDTRGERAGLVTSVGPDGSVGCAVLLHPHAGL